MHILNGKCFHTNRDEREKKMKKKKMRNRFSKLSHIYLKITVNFLGNKDTILHRHWQKPVDGGGDGVCVVRSSTKIERQFMCVYCKIDDNKLN